MRIMKYKIRKICTDDYDVAVDIYNSNKDFLMYHLGISQVDRLFIENEVQAMQKMGFQSCIVYDEITGDICGLIDYKDGAAEGYLSLLMIKKSCQGKGLGKKIFSIWEDNLLARGICRVRIDVVYDYPKNAVLFWEKLGFKKYEKIELTWDGKKMKAVVMKKIIG